MSSPMRAPMAGSPRNVGLAAESGPGNFGLLNPGPIHANLPPARLTEMALVRQEAVCSERGALVAYTGAYTGRAPRDRYLVAEPAYRDDIAWGEVNRPMEPEVFEQLYARVGAYLQGRE